MSCALRANTTMPSQMTIEFLKIQLSGFVFMITLTCDQVIHQSSWHTEDSHQQVTDSQVEDEEVGDSAHALVLHHHHAHQRISSHA